MDTVGSKKALQLPSAGSVQKNSIAGIKDSKWVQVDGSIVKVTFRSSFQRPNTDTHFDGMAVDSFDDLINQLKNAFGVSADTEVKLLHAGQRILDLASFCSTIDDYSGFLLVTSQTTAQDQPVNKNQSQSICRIT